MQEINNNQELSNAIEKIIDDNGIKKKWLSEKTGIINQNLNRFIKKKNLSLDEANRILDQIGYKAKIIIKKK